ncbi:OmpA family protein [Flavobacterium sp.]|uniref:OmpA family protein n=1 Tax=Flavobacterium sp. TaxID=239 RepID=UPI0026244FAE|nr:OmpA family protein [Flavobacterium sp.]MDD2984859.1 OmpA family protein [Flavobacterium sp.]
MKVSKILTFFLLCSLAAFAQETTVGDRVIQNAKDKTYQRGEQKSDETVDKALNKVEEGINGIFKKKDKKKKNETEEVSQESENTSSETQSTPQSNDKSPQKPVKKNSKFDFEPGQKQLGFDDFSTTNVGDFPLGWNTNSSAEIVTIDDSGQKWLFMSKDGYFQPEFINDMPDNFTLEFEIFTKYRSNNILEYQFYLMPSANPKKDLSNEYPSDYFQFQWMGCEKAASYFVVENGETISKNEGIVVKDLTCQNQDYSEPIIAKFSIWRQNSRLRIYVNENKVLDIPQAFDAKKKYNVFKIGSKYMNYSNGRENDDEFMISNIRYAVAGEDTRSKLITEGRFVTNGILFDVNSDNIKPESGVVLKEIATTLQENPTVKVKIIGHTDSDGDANANLALSQKRAVAVKNALASFYGIDLSRLETDGKGESQPLNNNASSSEKAQNRRVEFIKL